MILVRKMKDDNWMQTWYLAEATKMQKRATGRTKVQAVANLRQIMRGALNK